MGVSFVYNKETTMTYTPYNILSNTELKRVAETSRDPLIVELAQRIPENSNRPDRASSFAREPKPNASWAPVLGRRT